VRLAFPDRPFFKEFTLRIGTGAPGAIASAMTRARKAGFEIGPGFDRYAESGGRALSHCLLVAVTERRTRTEIDRLAEVFRS